MLKLLANKSKLEKECVFEIEIEASSLPCPHREICCNKEGMHDT